MYYYYMWEMIILGHHKLSFLERLSSSWRVRCFTAVDSCPFFRDKCWSSSMIGEWPLIVDITNLCSKHVTSWEILL